MARPKSKLGIDGNGKQAVVVVLPGNDTERILTTVLHQSRERKGLRAQIMLGRIKLGEIEQVIHQTRHANHGHPVSLVTFAAIFAFDLPLLRKWFFLHRE